MASSSSQVRNATDIQDEEFLTDFNLATKFSILEMLDVKSKKIKLYVAGPENTPYEGGSFDVELKFDDDYPNTVPKILFLTPVWNALVDPHTFVVVGDPGQTWSIGGAVDYVERVLRSVNSDQESICWKITRLWACEFAGKPPIEEDKMLTLEVGQLVEMGFDQMKALVALSLCGWEMELAAEHLLPQEEPELPIETEGEGPSNEDVANGDNADGEATEEEK